MNSSFSASTSNSSSHDNSIAQFVTMTGACAEVARHTLESSNWNIEMAINLYMDTPDMRMTIKNNNKENTKFVKSNLVKTITMKTDMLSPNNSYSKESLEKKKIKQLKEQKARNHQKGNQNKDLKIICNDDLNVKVTVFDNEKIRAPIAPKQEILVKDYLSMLINNRQSAAGFLNNRISVDGHNSIFVQGQKAKGLMNETMLSKRTLSPIERLFRQPTELMFNGTFESAKVEARLRNKWLLVNIQKSEQFASQALNRDLWTNPTIQQLVRQWFIFWQVNSYNIEGRQFVVFYHVGIYPYICIVDPRTGEQLISFTTTNLTAQIFFDQIIKYISAHSSAPENDRTSSSLLGSSSSTPYDQSEEAQLKAAIDASLKTQTDNNNKNKNQAILTNTSKLITTTWQNYIGSDQASKWILQIRLPNGYLDRICLPSDSKIKALYLYLWEKHCLHVGSQYSLFTNCPRKRNVSESCAEEDTLEEAGIRDRDALYLQEK